MMIKYKRCHSKLLSKMFHKWEIISYKIKFSINNELNKELEEPKLEKKPKIYSKIIKEEKKERKKIKNEFKDNVVVDLKNKIILNEKNEETDIKEINKNIGIEEEIIEGNHEKDLIEYDKINENGNDIINNNKDNSFINDMDNNVYKGISKSKSVDKFKNISFKVEKPKKWEYSYYIKKNNDDNLINEIKKEEEINE